MPGQKNGGMPGQRNGGPKEWWAKGMVRRWLNGKAGAIGRGHLSGDRPGDRPGAVDGGQASRPHPDAIQKPFRSQSEAIQKLFRCRSEAVQKLFRSCSGPTLAFGHARGLGEFRAVMLHPDDGVVEGERA